MNTYKVLLVEDDDFLKDILVRKFSEESSFDISHATQGKEAIEIAESEQPDIILLDIILPGMSGFDVIDELKNNDATSNIPVIFVSNLGQDSDIKKGREKGAVDFLVKANHSLDDIVARVKEILAGDAGKSTSSLQSSGDTSA